MALTPEELSITLVGMDKELTSLRKQNSRLHFIVAALLRALPSATAIQALKDLQHVEPGTSQEAFEAQDSAAVFVEQILSFSKGTDVTHALHAFSGDKHDS